MRRIPCAIALALTLLCGSAVHASVESDLVKQGLAAYRDLDYDRAIELFRRALGETLTKEEAIVTYRTLAFAHVALGRTEEAKRDFQNLLRVDGSYELDRTISPRVRTVFEAAKATLATDEAQAPTGSRLPTVTPELNPRVGREGQGITVRVGYPGGVAQRMELFHRSGRARAFARITAAARAGDRFEVVIPGLAVHAPTVQYYVLLLDDHGASVARAASLGQPFVIDVQAPPKPLYARGWFWGTVGGVAAAGAIATTLLLVLGRRTSQSATVVIMPR